MHAYTHARTHARTHTRMHTRTHARTHTHMQCLLTSQARHPNTSNAPARAHLGWLVELTKILLISLRQEHLSDACPVGYQHFLLEAAHLTTVVMDK